MGSILDWFKGANIWLALIIIALVFIQPSRDIFNYSIRGITNILFFDNSLFSVIFLVIALFIVYNYFYKSSSGHATVHH